MEITSKQLLQTIQNIYKTSESSKSFEEIMKKTEEECKVIMDFYSVTHFEGLILSAIIHDSVKEKLITNNSLSKVLHMDFCEMAEMVKAIRKLARQDMVGSLKDREHGIKYLLKPVVLQSAYSAEKLKVKAIKEDETFAFINNIRNESLRVYNGEITTFEILIFVKEIIEDSKQQSFVQWLIQQKLNIEDVIVLMNCCYEHIVEDPIINIDLTLSLLFNESFDRYAYKKKMINGENILIRNNLMEWRNGELNAATEVLLSQKTIKNLLINNLQTRQQQITSKYFQVVKGEDISKEQLFYNLKEEQEIKILKNALDKNNYSSVSQRLKENNFSAGLSILFHGLPGTGKTSTVYQIAKETGRLLLYTDASTLKSMWLGESEKNIKKLFDDYKSICLQCESHPILLFNEADAILSNRVNVNRSVDQTMNTIQNILLQELENFEGIFIATTNLTKNIDPAFERRFLYKVCFEKPSDQIISLLLKQAFPEIATEEIKELPTYALTGANISNIKKRLLIKKTFENVEINSYEIKKLIGEEFYNKREYKQIGFNKSLNN